MTQAIEPVSKTYRSHGLNLHYLDWGNDGAPPLFLLHGTRDHARSWDWVARALRDRWHIIVPDLRGHGDSDWSPDGAYHAPYFLFDFINLVDLLGHERISIIAHSFGGNPALRFAALYPQRVRKLVLVDAMGPTPAVVARWNEIGMVKRTRDWLEKARAVVNAAPKRYAAVEQAVTRMAEANPHLSAAQAHHLAMHGVRRYADGFGWKYDPLIGNFLPEDFAIDLVHYWREISAPTLICWGTDSWTSDPATDGSAAHFRDHRNLTFDKAGHWLHHDQLDKFLAAVDEFL